MAYRLNHSSLRGDLLLSFSGWNQECSKSCNAWGSCPPGNKEKKNPVIIRAYNQLYKLIGVFFCQFFLLLLHNLNGWRSLFCILQDLTRSHLPHWHHYLWIVTGLSVCMRSCCIHSDYNIKRGSDHFIMTFVPENVHIVMYII